MNELLIDNALLVISFLIAIIIIRMAKKRKTGIFYSFFLLFPALLVFLNMWAHTFAVIIVNFKRYQAGSFHYNFLFYSHLLFGLVFILLSGVLIHFSRGRIEGQRNLQKPILIVNGIMAVLFLPVGFINPLGFLPVISAILSSATIGIGNIHYRIYVRQQTAVVLSK